MAVQSQPRQIAKKKTKPITKMGFVAWLKV
jgi:hypothetical protein